LAQDFPALLRLRPRRGGPNGAAPMGQLCGPQLFQDPTVGGGGGAGLGGPPGFHAAGGSWPSAQSQSAQLTPFEAGRRIEQLDLELRMLKDDNYRIREEQLRLERSLKQEGGPGHHRSSGSSSGGGYGLAGGYGAATGGGDYGRGSRAGAPSRGSYGGLRGSSLSEEVRVDSDQQLMYMKEQVRNMQEENRRVKSKVARGGGGVGPDVRGDFVSEEQYRALQEKLADLQQRHLQRLQEARHLQGGRSSAGGSAANSGLSTPVSTNAGRFSAASSTAAPYSRGHTPQDGRALQSQYQALLREQEMLRAKVRKLASAAA